MMWKGAIDLLPPPPCIIPGRNCSVACLQHSPAYMHSSSMCIVPIATFSRTAFIALPFVTLKKKEERKGGFGDAETYWNDVPTDDACADNVRGRAYAKMAVAAINADKCHVPRGLQLTFEHIFLDAVRRREKG